MKQIAKLTNKERLSLFKETSVRKGMSPSVVEKDFWVCWVLMLLFEHPCLSQLLRFKGGTSLSKCFGLIDRFSEDIDLILDWTTLTTENPNEPRSKTQQDKFNKRINLLAVDFIAGKLLPEVKALINPQCHAEIDVDDNHVINISYPQNFISEYQLPVIKLEIGPLASMIPSGKFDIKPYAADEFSHIFTQPTTQVIAIQAERTFWEKITILHAEAHRPATKPQPLRYSRHYYDVFKMLGTAVEARALENLALMKDVVDFKSRFYHSAWANYSTARPGSFNLIPKEVVLAALQKDYANMRQMIFGTYPDFIEIIDSIRDFENSRLNMAR